MSKYIMACNVSNNESVEIGSFAGTIQGSEMNPAIIKERDAFTCNFTGEGN